MSVKHMLNQKEAAEYLGVDWETLRKWTSKGLNIPCYRYPDPKRSRPRFRKDDLDKYLERHRVNPRERMKERHLTLSGGTRNGAQG